MRILAFTTDASLEVALASLDERFEIVTARDPEGALAEACRSDLALVALGTTERGRNAVEALHRLRVGIPCLIVGDVPLPAPEPTPEPTPVLVRPFSLSELTEAMVVAAQRPTPRTAPEPEPEPVIEELAPELLSAPAPDSVPTEPDPVAIEVVAEADPVLVESGAAEQDGGDPLRDAVAEAVRQAESRADEAIPAAAVLEERRPPLGFPDHETVEDLLRQLEAAAAATAPSGPPAPPQDPVTWALTALHEIDHPSPASASPPPRSLPPGAAPEAEATAARIMRHAASAPRNGNWLSDRTGERNGLHRLRRRRRAIQLPGSPRASLMRRVRNALEGARELESLLDEIPSLSDPHAMARALVRETVELLGPETAVLYASDADGYRVAASHGLSAVEQSIVVPREQALFTDIASRMEAVLVAPVDLVRGLVSGIGGTNCDAMMLAPLDVDGRCAGILLAGRSRFGDEDLERLWHLAEEAAPGFAAARLIDRLRHRQLPVAL